MKAYLAARYDHREEMKGYARQLMDRGISVPARWIWVGNEEQSWPEIALKDLEDLFEVLNEGGLVVSFTETNKELYNSGGRHVEFGAALATNILFRNMADGGPVPSLVRIGPPENVFHEHPYVAKFETFEEFLADLDFNQTIDKAIVELAKL